MNEHAETPETPPNQEEQRPEHARPRRRRLLWVIVAVAVVLLAGLAWFLAAGRGEPAEPVTPAPVTVTNPLPTPAITPFATEATSAFHDLLPPSVLQYAMTSSTVDESKRLRRALESYKLVYSDGAGHEIVVRVSQWETPEQAETFAQALDAGPKKALPDADVTEDDVVAGTDVVGRSILRLGPETGQVTWRNGTAALSASGPAEDLEDFFTAFPL